MTPIILASSSPRRRELLNDAGVPFSVVVSGCDETPIEGESAQAMVERLAYVKADAVAVQHPDAWVIGADTTVCIDGECLGKPEDEGMAIEMLARIQGRTHVVWGGFCVINRGMGVVEKRSYDTAVTMATMTQELIRWYVKTGEPMDKAGSYAIQGIGLQFVDRIDGSYSNVVGLNINALLSLLRALNALPERGGV
jgi:septum formation protein